MTIQEQMAEVERELKRATLALADAIGVSWLINRVSWLHWREWTGRRSPSATSSPEKTASGSAANRKRRKGAGPSP